MPHRNDARETLTTLEALLACAQSAVDGNLAMVPLARDRDPLSELEARRRDAQRAASPFQTRNSVPATLGDAPPPPEPEVAVIIVLPDHWGVALACVESVVRGQTYPRDRFEVIVITDGADLALDSQVKALLGRQDRLICHATTNELLLYDISVARAAARANWWTLRLSALGRGAWSMGLAQVKALRQMHS